MSSEVPMYALTCALMLLTASGRVCCRQQSIFPSEHAESATAAGGGQELAYAAARWCPGRRSCPAA